MHLPKCWLTIVTILLVKVRGHSLNYQEESAEGSLSQTDNSIPYWEYILREFVFKTISPPPPANNALYRRLLEAPLYTGPLPPLVDQDSVILSRGDVYSLPSGHWILCQEGCTNCEICLEQSNPTVKWTLRRVKRESSFNRVRYDLQLTIVPQVDESYHMKNLWPRTYVYVTTLNEQEKTAFQEAPGDSENPYSITGPRRVVSDEYSQSIVPEEDGAILSSKKSSKPVDDILPDTGAKEDAVNSVVGPESNLLKEKIEEDSVNLRYRNRTVYGRRHRSRDKPSGRPGPLTLFQHPGLFNASGPIESDVDSTNPRVILGTDQQGQKHLVHIVPGDEKSSNGTLDSYGYGPMQMIVNDNSSNSDRIASTKDNDDFALRHPTYDKVVRKVLDSLNSHRVAIERFFVAKDKNDHLENDMTIDNVKSNELRKRDDSTNYLTTESYNDDPIDRDRSPIPNDWKSTINRDNDNTGDYQHYELRDGSNFRTSQMILEKEPIVDPDRFTDPVPTKETDELVMTEPKEYDENFQKSITHRQYTYPTGNPNWSDLRNFEKPRTSSNLVERVMGYDHDNATDFLRDKFVY